MQALDKPDSQVRQNGNGSGESGKLLKQLSSNGGRQDTPLKQGVNENGLDRGLGWGEKEAERRGDPFARVIGQSEVIQKEIRKCRRYAESKSPVLIMGETGTGKEVFARAIHEASPRADCPFVAVNCGALPADLVESELFGHEAGAFTGASRRQRGLVEEAEHGTLFLDEVNSLPLPLQPKLLRFLQESEYRPLGSGTTRHADVRVISASNCDLAEAVAAHTFREDLYYRLHVLCVTLPPLRQRREDIPLLARFLILRHLPDSPSILPTLGPSALAKLMACDWPSNIRQLENIVECALAVSEGDTIEAEDIDLPGSEAEPEDDSFQAQKKLAVWKWEHNFLCRLVARCEGDVSEAARVAGKERSSLCQLLRKHHLPCRNQRNSATLAPGIQRLPTSVSHRANDDVSAARASLEPDTSVDKWHYDRIGARTEYLQHRGK